ncbi:Dihydroorotate dehydrogenase (quinone), mitochondrial, partial [Coemansia sp. RSA 2320]
ELNDTEANNAAYSEYLERRGALSRPVELPDKAAISGRELFGRMMETTQKVNQCMVDLIGWLRGSGYRVAGLTNNFKDSEVGGEEGVRRLLDEYVESSVEGMRKPDPRFYMVACRRLGVRPEEAVFLDDIAANVRAAAGLGMVGVRVRLGNEAQAVDTVKRIVQARGAAGVGAAAAAVGGGVAYLYVTDSRAGVHKYITAPLMRQVLDAEQAHGAAIFALKHGVCPVDRGTDSSVLEIELWGKRVSNPIGLAAGFDKNAEAVDGLFGLGFGLVEVGSITPLAQEGNARPRVFRAAEHEAVVNRMGLPNCGAEESGARLRSRFWRLVAAQSKQQGATVAEVAGASNRSGVEGRLLGVNVSKGKGADSASFDDYVRGLQSVGRYADYVVINVSCPNVRNMGAGTDAAVLGRTVAAVVAARNAMAGFRPAVVLKIGPDSDVQQLRAVAQVALDSRVDGIIATNTTRQRPASAGSEGDAAA